MKTHIEFDYDLWTTVENGKKRYWTRVKASGEVAEVNEEIFRYMNNEDKKIRRQISDANDVTGTIYSLDAANEDGITILDSLRDSFDLEQTVEIETLIKNFKESLTEHQKDFFVEVIEQGDSLSAFGRAHGITRIAAHHLEKKVTEKLKRFYVGG